MSNTQPGVRQMQNDVLTWSAMADAPHGVPIIAEYHEWNDPNGAVAERVVWFYADRWRPYPSTTSESYADRWRPMPTAQSDCATAGAGVPDDLRRKSDRATPGPWAWEQCGDKEDAPVVGIAFPADDPDCKSPYKGEFRDGDASRMSIAFDWQHCDGHSPSANADFVVAAVNYVRSLLSASPTEAPAQPDREAMRESVARIVNPRAFGPHPILKHIGSLDARPDQQREALAKADAILAKLTPAAGDCALREADA